MLNGIPSHCDEVSYYNIVALGWIPTEGLLLICVEYLFPKLLIESWKEKANVLIVNCISDQLICTVFVVMPVE